MAVKEIVHDPIFLAQKSVPATDCTVDRQTVTDLLDTLRAHLDECVGMAANMIGVKKRIIVVAAGLGQFAMVNPVIVSKIKPYDAEEGCLSLLGGAVGVPLKSPQKTQYLILESVGKEWKSNYQSLEYDISNVIEDMHKSGLWDMSPYWCKITEHLLYTGEISHGTVLNLVMKLNEYKEPWYRIDPVYWEKALLELGIV